MILAGARGIAPEIWRSDHTPQMSNLPRNRLEAFNFLRQKDQEE
jgi:hypothetical protein